ncbi:hypothetical protein [Shewanella sp.]|uniref:hypothetical protein n=1 Tax=Shewanella sp. TaxID=50422 RepID=UPI004053CE13
MSREKYWIVNGFPIFISTGVFSIKALWDSWLLELHSEISFQAFALVFPIIVFSNALVTSIANAVMGTSKLWLHKTYIESKVLFGFIVAAIILGLLMALVLEELTRPFVYLFHAEKYLQNIHAFISSFIFWLPFQFVLTLFVQLSRNIELFRASSFIQFFSCIFGFVLSYWLISNQIFLEPLQSVVVSNAAISILSSLGLVLLLFKKLTFETNNGDIRSDLIASTGFKIFWTTFMGQSVAVVFISYFTYLLSNKGDKVIEMLAYLVRSEQLMLMLTASYINVMLPDMLKIINSGKHLESRRYIRHASRFLLFSGIIFSGFIFIIFYVKNNIMQVLIKESSELLLFSLIWLLGTTFQGVVIFYAQLLNVIFSPLAAIRLNFIRFLFLGGPLLFFGDYIAGGIGVVFFLMVLHISSFFLYKKKVSGFIVFK